MVAPRCRPDESMIRRPHGFIEMSERPTPREIPFNYTSADDRHSH